MKCTERRRAAIPAVRALVLGQALLVGLAGVSAQEPASGPVTNLNRAVALAEAIGSELRPHLGDSAAVFLSVEPEEDSWFVAEGVSRSVGKQRLVYDRSLAATEVKLGVIRTHVDYTDLRRTGLFGSREVTRTVSLELSATVVDRSTGASAFAGEFSRAATDTVGVTDIEVLETPRIRGLTGTVPSEGFFSTILEPLVTLAAIGVAVFLLFTVRS